MNQLGKLIIALKTDGTPAGTQYSKVFTNSSNILKMVQQ